MSGDSIGYPDFGIADPPPAFGAPVDRDTLLGELNELRREREELIAERDEARRQRDALPLTSESLYAGSPAADGRAVQALLDAYGVPHRDLSPVVRVMWLIGQLGLDLAEGAR